MDRIVLDTGVLIGLERGSLEYADFLTHESDIAIPTMVIGEYHVGVRNAASDARMWTRLEFLNCVLAQVSIVSHDEQVAEHHGDLLAYTRRNGLTRGGHDLAIAAAARATRRTIVTTDAKAGFGDLPGIAARVLGR